MKFTRKVEKDHRTEWRIRVIVELGLRRDRILESPELDLEALAVLAADYEAAEMPCAAADLWRRLKHYRESDDKGVVAEEKVPLRCLPAMPQVSHKPLETASRVRD